MNASEVAAALEKRIRAEFPNLDVDVETYDVERFIRWRVTDHKSGEYLRSDKKQHHAAREFRASPVVDMILARIRDWAALKCSPGSATD